MTRSTRTLHVKLSTFILFRIEWGNKGFVGAFALSREKRL
jgi:hypothetical protein